MQALVDDLFANRKEAFIKLNANAANNAALLRLAVTRWGMDRVLVTKTFDEAVFHSLLGAELLSGIREVWLLAPVSLHLFPRMRLLGLSLKQLQEKLLTPITKDLRDTAAFPLLTSLSVRQKTFNSAPLPDLVRFWEVVNMRTRLTEMAWLADDWEGFDVRALPMLRHVQTWATDCPDVSAVHQKLLGPSLRAFHGQYVWVWGEYTAMIHRGVLELLVSRAKTLEEFVIQVPSSDEAMTVPNGITMERLRSFMLLKHDPLLTQFAMNNLLGARNTVLTTFAAVLRAEDPQAKTLYELLTADPTVSHLDLTQDVAPLLSSASQEQKQLRFCPSPAVTELTVPAFSLVDACLYGGQLSKELQDLKLEMASTLLSPRELELPLKQYTQLREFEYTTQNVAPFTVEHARHIAAYLPRFPPTLHAFTCNMPNVSSDQELYAIQVLLLGGLSDNKSLVTFSCETNWSRPTQEPFGGTHALSKAMLHFLGKNHTLAELGMPLLLEANEALVEAIRQNRTLEYMQFAHAPLTQPVKIACLDNRRARLLRLSAHAALTAVRALNRVNPSRAGFTTTILPDILKLANLPSDAEWNEKVLAAARTIERIGADRLPSSANDAIDRDQVVANTLQRRKRKYSIT